ncbi:hypothetical protein [Anaerobacillus sp. 1_MG-2023]|uniref:hypothetical protein n=1 Tax=Anaerobacillus sp. 1_MG-2023 TaxID=3062655 RepID=UPI0026E31BEF|nr:hypothetical protein [Anaerobacillus sp. 1_MG-2023]MDO6655924.1 hypothetical protein [Anaerobacillus sp. 1_MG-2023]
MNQGYPLQIVKIQQEKKLIRKFYNEFSKKLNNNLSIDEIWNGVGIFESLKFDESEKVTEEQKSVVMSFYNIFIGVYTVAGIREAHSFAMNILK